MGTTEIVFIMMVYLLVFGTKGLPSMARSIGRVMRQAKDATQDIQREILSGTDGIRKEAQSMRDAVNPLKQAQKPGKQAQKPGEPRKPEAPEKSEAPEAPEAPKK